MASPVWFVNLITKTFPQIFILAKATRIPILGQLIDYLLFHQDDIMYLPKTRSIKVNQSLEKDRDMVIPDKIMDHFIEKASHRFIMNSCICRKASACKDYPIDLGCLFLGQAVLGINPELGRLVSLEEAREHVKKCREKGLVHLIGRNKLDTVWLHTGPGHKLLTICNCCPCCCLWRILPHVNSKIAEKVTRMPGVTVTVTDKCVGCGICTQGACFVDALQLVDNKSIINENCRGCGRCADICPEDAIELTISSPDAVNLAVQRIADVVAVD
jgi:formate hydrogenlyase subunit 6/NADH:ubiquinone oxidoreductase subunit I